jgi:hypothetical protein
MARDTIPSFTAAGISSSKQYSALQETHRRHSLDALLQPLIGVIKIVKVPGIQRTAEASFEVSIIEGQAKLCVALLPAFCRNPIPLPQSLHLDFYFHSPSGQTLHLINVSQCGASLVM